MLGLSGSYLGAFGHNWVHIPKYKTLAYLSLDVIGFSSDGWFREHNLQHHMYTNTPWDNHFKGTDPFLITDPTVERNWFNGYITPVLLPIVLIFGLPGNFINHLMGIFDGSEIFSLGKLLLPAQIAIMYNIWGWWTIALYLVYFGTLGNYYFTLALMNHNAENSQNVDLRNASKDWGETQLNASADWGVNCSFLEAMKYLWLNFHTVHHLFPRICFSHHSGI
jgi:fatty acid desaturase